CREGDPGPARAPGECTRGRRAGTPHGRALRHPARHRDARSPLRACPGTAATGLSAGASRARAPTGDLLTRGLRLEQGQLAHDTHQALSQSTARGFFVMIARSMSTDSAALSMIE